MTTSPNVYSLEANLLSVLAHPARLEIIELLREREQCVCHIQAMLDQRQAYISQHLNILRKAGLVIARKEGKRVYYRVVDPHLFDLIGGVLALLKDQGNWQGSTVKPNSHTKPRQPCSCPQCTEVLT